MLQKCSKLSLAHMCDGGAVGVTCYKFTICSKVEAKCLSTSTQPHIQFWEETLETIQQFMTVNVRFFKINLRPQYYYHRFYIPLPVACE